MRQRRPRGVGATGERLPPATGELLVCKAGCPELPENADEAQVQVLSEVGASAPPLLREELRPDVELSLALEQTLVLVFENGDEESTLPAEVIVDERQLHARLLGDSAHRRSGVAPLTLDLAGGGKDLSSRRGAALHSGLRPLSACGDDQKGSGEPSRSPRQLRRAGSQS